MRFLLLVIPVISTLFIIAVNGGLVYFFDPLALVYLLLFSFSLFGFSEGKEGFNLLFRAVFQFQFLKPDEKEKAVETFGRLIHYIYISGITALVVGQIMLLNIFPLSEFSTQRHIADTFLTLLFSLVLNEVFLRPIKNTIQNKKI